MSRHIVRSLHVALGLGIASASLVAATSASQASGAAHSATLRPPSGAASTSTAKALSPVRYSHTLARQMNKVRERHDLRPLRVVTCMNGFAAPWARHMANSGDLVHQELGPIMSRCNLSSAGEIIAYGGGTPRQMIGRWLDSPGHRDLLLEPSFRIAGVAGRRGHSAWWGCIDFGHR